MTLMGLRDADTGAFTFPEETPILTPLKRIEPRPSTFPTTQTKGDSKGEP